ncbi:PAS domain-containing hybrid sensor histidine kinase/response regulator [Rariglobus hedericola]|uniref:histidine kinase n=1 Tax=Rariglobus hedericola TaxID=2597822 RepID=A0A556QR63_9BACT|nr:PAS domain-containing sensor histidine kinase [Rariglobus hedericola]TSJ79128.1 PAS domain S-box protein [Rariglobus hedericola]
MPGWIAENRDYLFFVLACLTLFGLLETWLRRRTPHGCLPWMAWPALGVLLCSGWFLVENGGQSESRRIQDFMQGVAPTYAQEMTRMGHAGLTLDTPPDDTNYQRMIAATKRWKAVNPVISDVYTFRKIDGVVRLFVSSETDYDRDGKFEGPREQRVPLGKEYPQADENMLRALAGERTFSDEPVHDEWGVWVSAQVPLFDEQGKIEGALGVDYPAEKWIAAISVGRQRMIWLMAVPVLILGFATATTGALRTEVDARRSIEKQLRESEARLRTAIDGIPFDVWVMDLTNRYVLTNASSRENWGECVGKGLADLGLTPEALKMWEEKNLRAFAGEVVRSEVFQMVDGESRLLHSIIAPVRVADKVLGIIGLNVDFTERFKAEEALRKSERRFALHVMQTPLAVIEWDTEFRVTAWNPSAERIFGFTAAEMLGKVATPFIVVESAREQVAEVWQSVINRRGGWRNTNENCTKDGRVILCDWYNTPLVDDDGRVIGVASHCEDITQREILEKQLRQTQKIESLGQLAAGVAHEFNNLLTPMLLRLEMLRADREGDPDLLAALRSIEDAIEQAAQLNQRILAVGRRSSGKRELMALNPVVDDTIGLLRHTVDRRIALDMKLAAGLGPLLLDRSQVAQIVVNLTLNARDTLLEKYPTFAGTDWIPRIEVSTTMVQAAAPVEGASYAPFMRACQRLTVSDNGAGMTTEVRSHVFEPFYTTKSPGQGTGLGLAVVWNVVKNLNGWIEIESQPGEGTSFHVYFPVPDAPPPVFLSGPPSPVAAVSSSVGNGLNILLVDDNIFVAETINRLLTREGHNVTYAQNGEEAWELCSDGKDGAFDLIMTDQNMPVMTGVELVRTLRKAGSTVRVVVVSGHLSAELTKELNSLGVNGLLAKPFTQKELMAMVAASVSASREQPRPSAG